ncbi:MAG TPA: hypothetical protein VEC13_03420 [Candidatus Paceibacterota bacterium]|nr:hypothetical protein [Candidatus Paceibacterota bacterium]
MKGLKLDLKNIHFSLGWDADKDWRLLGIVFLCLFFVMVGFNIFFFFQFKSANGENGVNQTAPVIVDRQKLISVIESLDTRATEFQRIRSEARSN